MPEIRSELDNLRHELSHRVKIDETTTDVTWVYYCLYAAIGIIVLICNNGWPITFRLNLNMMAKIKKKMKNKRKGDC